MTKETSELIVTRYPMVIFPSNTMNTPTKRIVMLGIHVARDDMTEMMFEAFRMP